MQPEMDDEELKKSEYVKGGQQRWIDFPEESLYVVQGCHIVLCFIACFGAAIYLQFVLIPMGMAYFITFLLAPIMDSMEDRPYQFGSKFYCKENFLHPARKRYQKTARGELLDTVLLGKVPHMLAVLICFIVIGTFFSALIGTISGSFAEFSAAQDEKLEAGGKPMGVQLNDMFNEQIDQLEASGILIKRQFICYAPDGTEMILRTVPTDEKGLYYLRLYIFKDWFENDMSNQPAVLEGMNEDSTNFNCSKRKIFGTSEGMTVDDIMGYVGMFGGFVSDMIGIALLSIYILLERPPGATVKGDHIVAEQIEVMFKTYISMKTALSFVTGILTAIILVACACPLGAVFGLLAFLLNYIPNVGSIIAMVLPVPIIILDEDMSFTIKIIAMVGPASVQGYIGNVAEPMMMGEALNLTAISILVGLVFFSFVFGIYGAVLSVPIQAAAKIMLHHTDHPLAKGCLTLMREDRTLDYENDRLFLETKADRNKLTDIDSVDLTGTEFEIKTDA
jgi:predicted PurR-regulated permease PerM